MSLDKYDIRYVEKSLMGKPIFMFVNHKVGVLCWAKIKKLTGKKGNVVTFDSHRDFRGIINGEDQANTNENNFYRSEFVPNKELKHFKENKEFLNWDMLDDYQNEDLIGKKKKFLLSTNDNFIEVAFMKDIIGNVYWYYLEAPNGGLSGKCDDLNGKVHSYIKCNLKRPRKITKPFILDIDLDFFARVSGWAQYDLFSEEIIDKYLAFQKSLFDNDLCLGVTIALEPEYCGGSNKCLKIVEKFSKVFGTDLSMEADKLIKKSYEETDEG